MDHEGQPNAFLHAFLSPLLLTTDPALQAGSIFFSSNKRLAHVERESGSVRDMAGRFKSKTGKKRIREK